MRSTLECVRRVVVLLLATAALVGAIAVVASGSDAASHRSPGARVAALAARVRAASPWKTLTLPAPPPQGCSVAGGACVEGCARPVSTVVASPRPVSGICHPSPSQPCFELVAGHAAKRASFCTSQRPFPLLRPFRPAPKRGR